MDALLVYIKRTLPQELSSELSDQISDLENGRFGELLSRPIAREILSHEDENQKSSARLSDFNDEWNDFIFKRLGDLLSVRSSDSKIPRDSPLYLQYAAFFLAIASLQAFVQSNITGPPLSFSSSALLFPESVAQDENLVASLRTKLVASLSVDGEAAYKLTPNVELLCLADTILTCPPIKKNVMGVEWAILRTGFMHQRLLSELSPTLQESIYDSLDSLDDRLAFNSNDSKFSDLHASYLLEKATVHIHFGLEQKAKAVLENVARLRNFEFALTGVLGKRTKFQELDTSQLVVLAKSDKSSAAGNDHRGTTVDDSDQNIQTQPKPKALDLNDDTLLETISFSKTSEPSMELVDRAGLPESLASLDPENQPLLHPLDSITLLSLASSITNTRPADGLTREETMPYATRVLNGGSSNWQVYTQALLLRSRIEGYRSRTTERGLLQLQALVDQVVAETSGKTDPQTSDTNGNASTFLPRANEAESAPSKERLLYVYELCSPTRWELEAELAARWVSLGGLRTALEIYNRLEMRAEEALCWAAIEREDKARTIIRRQLFHSTSGDDDSTDPETEQWKGALREPLPTDAPRLFCILGDIDRDITKYEKAWEVSHNRYARAQRSIGKYYFSRNKFVESAAAYSKALKVNQLNQSSWFALGCCLLELDEFARAAEAFTKTVQLDDTDAEAWSNLAAALLKLGRNSSKTNSNVTREEGDEDTGSSERPKDPQQYIRDALKALKRAASLKYESHRIWDNLLTVAASTSPPEYTDMVAAQRRIIELRGTTDGEKCIDVPIIESIVRHVVATNSSDEIQEQRGLPRLLISLLDDCMIPLITSSARLWRLVATLSLWRQKPDEALEANEKAWRVVTNPASGWETGTEEQWNEVVEATEDLCDAYESLSSHSSAGNQGGEVAAKDWRFKARSAVRTVMGKAKSTWEDTPGWTRLEDRLEALKATKTS